MVISRNPRDSFAEYSSRLLVSLKVNEESIWGIVTFRIKGGYSASTVFPQRGEITLPRL